MAPPGRSKYISGVAYEKKKPSRLLCHLKVAILFLIVVCAVLLVIIVTLIMDNCKNDNSALQDGNSSQLCLSPDCVKVSSLYLSNMDQDTDPCEDFFQYACGSFVKENILYGSTDLIRDLGLNSIPLLIDKKLIKLLEQSNTTLYGNHSEAVRKLKDLYSSCFQESGKDAEGAEMVPQKFIEELGGWSLSGTAMTDDIDLEKVLATAHRKGDQGIFSTWVVANPFNDLMYQLRLQSPGRFSLSTVEYVTSVVKLLRNSTVVLPAASENRIQELIEIEYEISELTPEEEYRKDPLLTLKSYALSEIEDLFGGKLHLARYLKLLLGPTQEAPTTILVESIDFLKGVSQLMHNYSRAAVADYIIWTSINVRLPYLSKPFYSLHEKHSRGIFSKADSCLQLAKTYFSQALGAIYVQSYHDKSLDLQLSDMMFQLQEAFEQVIHEADWLEDGTRNKTLEKLASMDRIVAYMKENVDARRLDSLYVYHGPIDHKNLFRNVNHLMSGTYSRLLALLGRKETIVDAVSEQQAPHDTGATYASHQNTIIVWAGLLQFAFFDDRFPTVLKYGGLGFVIGHEIIHGFDNAGRNYDVHGRYAHWWDNDTISHFKEKAQCFIDQYSQYQAVSPYIHFSTKNHRTFVDGNRTLGENIADNGAVKIAYSAYQNWAKINGGEARLPGMNLTDEQLFFLGMATPLCTVEAPLLSIYNIMYDVHTQARYRVLGSLRNFDKFAQAFDCPLGSSMNPEEKCSVW